MQAGLASLRAVRHWVFDLDGTLTVAVHDFDLIRSQLGIPPGELILEYIAARPSAERQALHADLHAIERELALLGRAAHGAHALLEHLRARHARLSILTRNARELAWLTLEAAGLSSFFVESELIGRDEASPKPSPAGLLTIAARWNVSPRDCAMVGDYRFDLEAGRAVGALTVHVDAQGTFAWPELSDVCVRSLYELLPTGAEGASG